MCGIVGFTGVQGAAPILLDGLKKLEYRGYDSAGIAVMDRSKISVSKVTGRIANLCAKTHDGADVPGVTGIGHTRWATHGAPTEENAHPHLSNDGRFAVVHNGIIENYLPLREELIRDGYHFESETDTEVIVHLIELYYKGDMHEALVKTTNRLQGSYALGVICADEPGKMYAVREASPLILGVGLHENFFASDVTALVAHTRNVIYLEDGEFAELTGDTVRIFDCLNQDIDKKISRISWNVQAAEKGGYEHFMMKEIMEQPGAVKATIAPRIRDGRVAFDELTLTAEDLREIRQIVITACGSAYYAGCAARYALERLTHIPVVLELASELRYSDPLIDEHTLTIVISQSGETLDTRNAMKIAKEKGSRTIAVVNVIGSTIAREADYVLYTAAGPEISVASTKAYTTQLGCMYLMAIKFAYTLGCITPEKYKEYHAELLAIPEKLKAILSKQNQIQRFASTQFNADSIFFMGRGLDYYLSMEASLKLKEISYIHSEAYAGGELKHGTIALIEDGTLVVSPITQDELASKMESNIKEVRTRGATVLAIIPGIILYLVIRYNVKKGNQLKVSYDR